MRVPVDSTSFPVDPADVTREDPARTLGAARRDRSENTLSGPHDHNEKTQRKQGLLPGILRAAITLTGASASV